MFKLQVTLLLALTIMILGLSLAGCNAQRVPVIGDVGGPQSMLEGRSADFTSHVEATGVTFNWSCDPPLAGYFLHSTSPRAQFIAGSVAHDTWVTIRVVIDTNEFGSIIKTRKILVRGIVD